MPAYRLKCNHCGKGFEVFLSIREKERGVKCPFCESPETNQVYSPFYIKGAKNSSSACSTCTTATCNSCHLAKK